MAGLLRRLTGIDLGSGGSAPPAAEITVNPAVTRECVSILKAAHRRQKHPYPSFSGSSRSEEEHINGRDQARRVTFKLPEGAVSERTTSRRNSARKRSHLSHRDILTLYRQACMAGDLEAIDSVVAQLERAARGDRDASQRLCIEGVSSMTVEQALSIGDVIYNNGTLRSFEVIDCKTSNDVIKILCSALLTRRCCCRLKFSGTTFGSAGMADLMLLAHKLPLLSYLNLSNTKITRSMAEHMRSMLPRSHLRTLILHNCHLGEPFVLSSICRGVAACDYVANVSFKSNNIGPQGGRSIAQILGENITCLDLRCNKLGDDGARALAVGLQNAPAITKLVLYDNNIDAVGARAIFKGLKHCNLLESLDMSSNRVGDGVTMARLKEALCHNTVLRNLYLWNACLTNDGAVAVGELLAENRCLWRLELRKNSFGLAGLMALCHTMKVNSTLFKLLIDVPLPRSSDEEEVISHLYADLQNSCAKNLVSHQAEHKQSVASSPPDATGPEADGGAEGPNASSPELEEEDDEPRRSEPVDIAPQSNGQSDDGAASPLALREEPAPEAEEEEDEAFDSPLDDDAEVAELNDDDDGDDDGDDSSKDDEETGSDAAEADPDDEDVALDDAALSGEEDQDGSEEIEGVETGQHARVEHAEAVADGAPRSSTKSSASSADQGASDAMNGHAGTTKPGRHINGVVQLEERSSPAADTAC